jgi:hypothetical protein
MEYITLKKPMTAEQYERILEYQRQYQANKPKKTISPEKYEKMLEYNRNYYADMSEDRKTAYKEQKKIQNRLFREKKKLEKLGL